MLRSELRDTHGLRWRYRQPWLILTGDDPTIKRLLPGLSAHGWLVTPDAVLLWSKTGQDGRPDEPWLKQLYKLRRRRPVDAVVFALDGSAELSAPRRGINVESVKLARLADALHWAAPVYVLDVAQTDALADGNTPVIGCEFACHAEHAAIEAALLSVRHRLADRSVAQLGSDSRDRYTAELSERLDRRSAPLASWVAALSAQRRRHQPVSGAFFVPYPRSAECSPDAAISAGLPVWHYLGEVARAAPGRRVGWHPVTVFSTLALVVIGLWGAGMLLAGLSNARDLHQARQAVRTLDVAPDPASQLRALLALQQQIDRYEYRAQQPARLLTRFGLDHDQDVLAALWKPYAQGSRNLLVAPIQTQLEIRLAELGQLHTERIDERTNQFALDGYQVLKAYLMLAEPARADAAFMAPLLTRYWRTDAHLPAGEKLDLSERLLGFYAQHLKAHEDWRIQARPELVNPSRQTLLAVIGAKNSEDTIYQGILKGVGNKYPDQSLASLTAGTDTRGLLRTAASVPGVFTRQAYEGSIAAALGEASTRSVEARDWVLANSHQSPAPAQTSEALHAALAARYFADYAEHWQGFMNNLQWDAAPSLPQAIEQLKLMADAHQSPVIALMKSLEYQGGAGVRHASLSDTLVSKAQNMFGAKSAGPQRAQPDPAGPLGAWFGTVLRLVAQNDANGVPTSELSLQRFMDRVTTLRLKLQQVSDSPESDAQARQIAQALFQGRGSELADTQAYAQLIAASLGVQWAGMGEALFVRPVMQATQTVLQRAQASLNDTWRQTIVATWQRSFAGRYPFANTDNDASLPELARFLRPQGGLIEAFLGSQLAGVLALQGDQWMPVATGSTALSFDPTFLRAINRLQRIAGHMLVQGEPQYRFDFKPLPTPGVTDTVLTVDGQRLHYYNQQQTWQALTWPTNDPQNLGTRLQWQTEQAGTNKRFEFGGRWGLVRMLERAHIEPVDNATFQLTWQAAPDTPTPYAALVGFAAGGVQAGTGAGDEADSLVAHPALMPAAPQLTYPLSYLMRTDVGKGPLELLALRGFKLPTRIFAVAGPRDPS